MKSRIPELHFYEWFVSRWVTSTAHDELDATGRGIYREMLDACYAQGSVTSDLPILARKCACTVEELEARWTQIRKHFVADKHDSSRLRNKFSDANRRSYFRFVLEQKKNGKKGGRGSHRQINGLESDGLATGKKNSKGRLSQGEKGERRTEEEGKKGEGGSANATAPPASAADPHALAERFVDAVRDRHWCLISQHKDVDAVERLLATATDPSTQYAALLESHERHRVWRIEHPEEKRRPALCYWISDGDYLQAPVNAARADSSGLAGRVRERIERAHR